MSASGAISFIIILVNFFFSYKGFTDRGFYYRHTFDVEKILVYKQYRRLISSGFLHVNWMHLIFNMVSLYVFSAGVEYYLGPFNYLLIYMASLLGGNLFSLFIHRHHGAFSSVGASGAVCGIIFAAIALFPGYRIGFFFLPISFPAWLYGLAYVLYSIYGIRSKRDNVGHEAHLAGALTGMIIAIILEPSSLINNYVPIIAVMVPALIFIYLIITNPGVLLVDNLFFKTYSRNYTLEDRYNAGQIDKQKEVDRILEKIHKKGMRSLTARERQTLARYSKTVR